MAADPHRSGNTIVYSPHTRPAIPPSYPELQERITRLLIANASSKAVPCDNCIDACLSYHRPPARRSRTWTVPMAGRNTSPHSLLPIYPLLMVTGVIGNATWLSGPEPRPLTKCPVSVVSTGVACDMVVLATGVVKTGVVKASCSKSSTFMVDCSSRLHLRTEIWSTRFL